jgi:hypothetical protein
VGVIFSSETPIKIMWISRVNGNTNTILIPKTCSLYKIPVLLAKKVIKKS